MKSYYVLAIIIAALAVTMCVTTQQTPQAPAPDIGANAPPIIEAPPTPPTYCGLAVYALSPSQNEKLSGGFRAEWMLVNGTGNFANQPINFTIYIRPANGETTDIRILTRYYGETYKEDITFLTPLAKGNYVVGIRGKIGDCTIHPAERDVIV